MSQTQTKSKVDNACITKVSILDCFKWVKQHKSNIKDIALPQFSMIVIKKLNNKWESHLFALHSKGLGKFWLS